MAAVVATSTKVVQALPRQRSIRYRPMPALSVAAVQARLICLPVSGVALRPDTLPGGTVSATMGSVTLVDPISPLLSVALRMTS